MKATYLLTKSKNVARRLLLEWGGPKMRESIWNREFSKGQWDCLKDTVGDCVYEFIEKYCNGGSILDLGCGSGSTGNELDITRYGSYTGIDVSGVAIDVAHERAKANGRSNKNEYAQSDITTYVPHQKYNVILFRDSIYYLPASKIQSVLDRYSAYLESSGVFIVRIFNREQYVHYVDRIESNYRLVERYWPSATKTAVLIFQ
jgi:SAM-dependent methyltransferase